MLLGGHLLQQCQESRELAATGRSCVTPRRTTCLSTCRPLKSACWSASPGHCCSCQSFSPLPSCCLQAAAIPAILKDRRSDFLLASHTGSGKTLAYLLPVGASPGLCHVCPTCPLPLLWRGGRSRAAAWGGLRGGGERSDVLMAAAAAAGVGRHRLLIVPYDTSGAAPEPFACPSPLQCAS